MKSFGRLLRTMRGTIPLSEIAARTALDERYLDRVEAGRELAEEIIVRHVFSKGFGLPRADVTRLVLGLELYDLGLRDPELRLLVVDLITKDTPARVRERIRALYQSYARTR